MLGSEPPVIFSDLMSDGKTSRILMAQGDMGWGDDGKIYPVKEIVFYHDLKQVSAELAGLIAEPGDFVAWDAEPMTARQFANKGPGFKAEWEEAGMKVVDDLPTILKHFKKDPREFHYSKIQLPSGTDARLGVVAARQAGAANPIKSL